MKKSKTARVLDIYLALEKGAVLSKESLAFEYEVDSRTIVRDLSDIRAYYADSIVELGGRTLKYDRSNKGYRMVVEKWK